MNSLPHHGNTASGILAGLSRHPGADRLHAQAEQESEHLIASMPLPDPFDLDRLVGNMAKASGRRIVMKPIPPHLAGIDGACGLLVRHDTHPLDLILHPEGCSPSHELELKVHQLVHLWAGDNTGVVRPPGAARPRTVAPSGTLTAPDPLERDVLVELRADKAARYISRRRRQRPVGAGSALRVSLHRGTPAIGP
ncbi:hypothetical protein [Streptomyces sp. NPDC056144]|uniref:hypothetical protein n=1 Tax=unclassified Streptomyces TaxID=2593676 RepID=UPI0035E1A80F